MKKNLKMPSAAVVIVALRVNLSYYEFLYSFLSADLWHTTRIYTSPHCQKTNLCLGINQKQEREREKRERETFHMSSQTINIYSGICIALEKLCSSNSIEINNFYGGKR